jgi:hypothetical protein
MNSLRMIFTRNIEIGLMRRPIFAFGIFLMVFANVRCGSNGNKGLEHPAFNHIKKIVFIQPSANASISKSEKNDLLSLQNSLRVAGIDFSEIGTNQLSSVNMKDYEVIVLPNASAKSLTDAEVKLVADAVKSGAELLFDSISKLNAALGIVHQHEIINISGIRDLQFPKNHLYWTAEAHVFPIDTLGKSYKILCIDDTTKQPIAINGTYGKGQFIYFAPLFDPITNKGYTRFPYLSETLQAYFGIKPLVERQAVEMYFDPGMRSDSVKIEERVKQWREHKIKRIHAAGWYYDTDFDYTALLRACHENGILVSCWLEYPMVSKLFWDKHPEWREKTAYLKDAFIDWRYLMNLADPDCKKQIGKEMEAFLLKYDWDGVNLAEVYFEPSPVGPELPENFTPMNDLVRTEFKKANGFDPITIFDTKSPHYWKTNTADWKKFANYRKELCLRAKKYFLDCLATVKSKKSNFETMLTVIDVSLTPELSDNIGENTKNALDLYKQYDITLQVEDPSNCWGSTPERYDQMGKSYRVYVKDKDQLAFDCNVVNSHEKGYGGFPSEIPSGEEIRQIAYNMLLHNSRPIFYSEDAFYAQDFENVSTVLAGGAKVVAESNHLWKITTPYTVTVHTRKGNFALNLDGKTWYAGEERDVIVPAGEHKIELTEKQEDSNILRIRSISGELKSAEFSNHTVYFSYYEAVGPCYVSIDRKPGSITIDHVKVNCELFTGASGLFTIKLPRGTHNVEIKE